MRIGETVSFGTWPQDSKDAPQPLEWRVLDVRPGGGALLITTSAIECRSYHDVRGDITWQNSYLRAWLNTVFLQHAFTADEQKQVALVSHSTERNKYFATKGGGDTDDRVFCLSASEVEAFMPLEAQRVAVPTPYACRDASTKWWWLRSPGGHQFTCAAVSEQGMLDYNGFHATLECIGVRPVLVLLPEPVEEEPPVCASLDISFDDAGVALRYAHDNLAIDLLKRFPLKAETARVAVSGGWPSWQAIERLHAADGLGETNAFHLCQAALQVGAGHLALSLLAAYSFDDLRLSRLLKTAVEAGSMDATQLLLLQGASGQGYARAYVRTSYKEAVASCALAADFEGAVECWEELRAMPGVLSAFIDQARADNKLERLLHFPGILSSLAEQGNLTHLRLLCQQPQAHFSCENFLEAIEAAKLKGHGAAVAFLLDQHATLFGASEEPRGPVLELL